MIIPRLFRFYVTIPFTAMANFDLNLPERASSSIVYGSWGRAERTSTCPTPEAWPSTRWGAEKFVGLQFKRVKGQVQELGISLGVRKNEFNSKDEHNLSLLHPDVKLCSQKQERICLLQSRHNYIYGKGLFVMNLDFIKEQGRFAFMSA
jgi:hypothetical protein